MSADALIDAVWGSERSSGVKRLHMAIARVRKAIEPLVATDESLLRTVSGGYLLTVAPGRLDADVFADSVQDGRRALADGDPSQATRLLPQALALWRGTPLAEVAFEDFAQTEIRRLEELRLTALETRIDAELQVGHHAELVGQLEALVAHEPTREHFAEQLMLVLDRSGRQADALAAFQRTRAYLSRELGIQPGPALSALHDQILGNATALATASSRYPRQCLLRRAPRRRRRRRSAESGTSPRSQSCCVAVKLAWSR